VIKISNYNIYLKFDLQLFAEGPGGEKTEKATPKKREKARNEGQVAKSTELINSVMLLAFFLSIKILVPFWSKNFMNSFRNGFSKISEIDLKGMTLNTATSIFRWGILEIIRNIWPILLVTFLIAIIMNVVQVKWKISTKSLQPKFSKLNPIKGMKKMFSPQTLMELVKSLAKVGIVVWITISTLTGEDSVILILYDVSLIQAIGVIGEMIIDLGTKISVFFLIVAFIDIKYVRSKFEKDLRMTKQEVKEEYKNIEGNPEIKGKIRRKQREISMRRMMQDLPTADVIITNPTHFAVAIKYDISEHPAPFIIAKGADLIAARIKEKAKEFKIEIVENKPLARMIYYNVEIGEQVPQEMYQAVAEVLAFVYSLKNKKK
jgi:flagellar biosynthetic protein FlhB